MLFDQAPFILKGAVDISVLFPLTEGRAAMHNPGEEISRPPIQEHISLVMFLAVR